MKPHCEKGIPCSTCNARLTLDNSQSAAAGHFLPHITFLSTCFTAFLPDITANRSEPNAVLPLCQGNECLA